MKHVIVIGGGLAGLSTAVYISEKGIKVTLLEASPKLGGRAYSISNQNQNDVYDNGQHLMMGCYNETLSFLKKIGSHELVEIQKNMEVTFVEEGGIVNKLSAPGIFYPFNLLTAVLKYKALSLRNRFRVINFIMDLSCCADEDLKDLSVIEWLLQKNQNDETLKKFWEILIVGTMNTTPEKASAQIFDEVLREVFLGGNRASKIVIPKVGLSELFSIPADKFLKSLKCEALTSEKVEKVLLDNNIINKIKTNKHEYEKFDAVVFAIPPHSFDKILFLDSRGHAATHRFQLAFNEFKYSSILNIHLWLKENPFKEKFYGFIESEIHWLFNHGKHISLTVSSADSLCKIENEKIVEDFYSELKIYFPIFKKELVTEWKVIKEKRATFIPDCASNELRKSIASPFPNMFFAGDWTDTELPATIEGAVLSGKLAAQKSCSFLNY
ncbi:MAG: crtP [Ignavibacteria bacterium]|nr:MAG: crtP [Ignavibacteria bacterium]KAF0161346.1 MAG: crtP [Ignavibacteria bacterium]